MNEQAATSGFTVGVSDDIHSYWRPAKVSAGTALTRASAWYTANTARVVNDVYIAPNGCLDGLGVLILEISGLGPWDVLTVSNANYAAAATSLNLATAAPSAASFMLAAVVGDNSSAGQAFAPAGWTTLHTVTATNGTNHVADVVLTSAYLASNSSSISVNGTASSAEDLSGVIIGIELNAASPITGTGIAPGWPGRMIYEMALGAGFETPQDELTWTTLNDSSLAPSAETKRFWGWQDSSGIPYALAGLQSSTGTATLDDADGALTPSNSASAYYPDVTTGTPVRLRVALGTLTGPLGSTTVNRWYVVQRNLLDAQEKRTDEMRNFVDASLTDIWSVVSGSCPTPFRGEIAQDNPYAWWPCDDAPLSGGVLPSSLANAALGNTNVLNVSLSPNAALETWYSTSGSDTYTTPIPGVAAVYSVGANAGWMYGDPQSSPASYATSNPVSSNPGSAAWQQEQQAGDDGGEGWWLSCNDSSFPPLSGGVTVEAWFNYDFWASSTSVDVSGTGDRSELTQPYAAQTIFALYTGSDPVAIMQLANTTGNLNFITYSGSTPTSNSIYTSSDLRSETFHHIAVVMTTTTWTVYVDGGITATVSGTASGMTSAWTWLLVNGDTGVNGGGNSSTIARGGNGNFSHIVVYPTQLPAARVLAHYCAAVTGFGVLPAPQGVAVNFGNGLLSTQNNGAGYANDGSIDAGTYTTTPAANTSMSARVVAVCGTAHSGPSAWVIASNRGEYAFAYVNWTGLAPQFQVYTASTVGSETEASIVAGALESYTSGYGSSGVGSGRCHVSGGSGASPPTGPSTLGDTVSQRIERCLSYGGITYPGRAIDTTPNLVQAALDIGGQSIGANIQAQVYSDNGWLFVDAPGNLCYRAKAHLAADSVLWDLTSSVPTLGDYPFKQGQEFPNDPQKVWNVIQIGQYSPDGATLPATTPASASAVNTSQAQYGPRPLPWSSSYLQSQGEIQLAANWLIGQYGSVHRRVESLTVNAAGYPPAWVFVFGVNPGDLVQITDQPMQGGPQSVGTYRVSSVSRRIFFGANGNPPEGSVTISADYEPTSYWS